MCLTSRIKADFMDETMTEKTHQWYALHTKAKAEYRVASALEQTGFEIFLPEITTIENTKAVKRPFFPCYLFMRANLNEVRASIWHQIPGLRFIVTNGYDPVHLPHSVIQFIQAKLEKLNSLAHKSPQANYYFQPGEPVRITSGPLSDMVAVFEGPTRPSQRVHVLLQVLNYQRRIQLDAANLEKVGEPTHKPSKRPRRTRGRGRRIKH